MRLGFEVTMYLMNK
ncbi:pyrroloquinoline quinone precursor peptide PqqA [Methylotenera oryzisoli]|uniref:Coenzyme PQQ synthesis protein A n=1 Tax=Methylotenera oryzisoli TaxID=2080758 RepID=A0A4Y9VUC2_9PROT|nr:pyrroloquinoline quinone precursor peptide PqqA [Methylotenera oryzisoli]